MSAQGSLENPQLEDLNELRGDSVPQLTPQPPKPISIKCPHCGHIGMFRSLSSGLFYKKRVKLGFAITSQPYVATLCVCPNENCRGIVAAVSETNSDGGLKLVRTLPSSTLGCSIEDLPPHIARTMIEAVECHGVGAYRASVIMVRRMLEELCDVHNAPGANLHQRIESLQTVVTLPLELFVAIKELKILGNDAAHVRAKEYDDIGAEEAELAIELSKEILKAFFQHRSLVERLRSLKKPAVPSN